MASADLLAGLLDDLAAESRALDDAVAGLPEAGWRTATPAPGWTVAHQVAHLAWTDDAALQAATDPDGFRAARPPSTCRRRWTRWPPPARRSRRRTCSSGGAPDARRCARPWLPLPPGTALPWFGPPMSAASMATARLMETWAHGVDVRDALGLPSPATARLRAVAHLGVRTRDFAFGVHGQSPPAEPFRVELTGPDGEPWTWGPPEAAQRVSGPALDLCLLVTQRRARADLALSAEGSDADRWLDLAQAFAGPPGAGRAARASA